MFNVWIVSGLHLDDAQREEIKALKNKIADLGTDFKSNLNEDTSFVELTEAELSGVPEDLIKTLEKVIQPNSVESPTE